MSILEYTVDEMRVLQEMLIDRCRPSHQTFYAVFSKTTLVESEHILLERKIRRKSTEVYEYLSTNDYELIYILERKIRRKSTEVYEYLSTNDYELIYIGQERALFRSFRVAMFEAPMEDLPPMLDHAVYGTIARWRLRLGR